MEKIDIQGEGLSERELMDLLSRAKYLWESTFDAISEPVLVVDKDYKIQRANLSAARDANQKVQALIGKDCFRIFAGRDSVCEACPIQMGVEKSNLIPFKNKQQYLASQFYLSGKNDDLDFHVVHYQNITKIRELEERLIQSEKLAAIGLLANGVAHEINNPLGGILAFAQIAKKDLDPESQTFQDLDEIEKSAVSCKKIIEDLLTFARPASKMEKIEFDLVPTIKKVIHLLKAQWKEKKATVKIDLNRDGVWVLGNPNRLEQVFFNLIANAFFAVEESGGITISSSREDHWVKVQVRDNGCGIASEHIAQVFDPYFSTKERGEGSGLGLSISYQIIQAHGGMLEVSSDDSGTVFSVYLREIKEA